MIVTLTANPSFDRTISLSRPLLRGEVTRADAVLEQAGGKGVNISRAAAAASIPTTAVFPADAESPFVHELERLGIGCRPVEPTGPIRVNLTLTEPDGTTTKVNTAGATADPGLLERLVRALHEAATGSCWVVLAGSLPPGAPASWYADVAAGLAGTTTHVAVDTSDAPLRELATRLGTARPSLLKPNAEELAQLTGGDQAAVQADPEMAAASAGRLLSGGAGTVLVTLGGAGAVLVTSDGAWYAEAPPVDVISTVGAGDSSLFGYVLGDLRGLDPADRLRLAVAYGSAAAALPGTTIPTPAQVHADTVVVHPLTFPVDATPRPRTPPQATSGTPAGQPEDRP